MATPVQPTQVVEPGRTTLRTVVQTIIGIVLAAGVVLPAALAIVGDEFAAWTSPELVAVLGTVSAVAVAVSAAAARIMAIPHVNAWLARVGLGAGSGSTYTPDPDAAWRRPEGEPMAVWVEPETLPQRARDDDGDGVPDVAP